MITSSASFGSAAMLRLARKKGNTCRMLSNATWEDLISALENGPAMVRLLSEGRRMSVLVLGWDYETVLTKKFDGTIVRMSRNEFLNQWSDQDHVGWMMVMA